MLPLVCSSQMMEANEGAEADRRRGGGSGEHGGDAMKTDSGILYVLTLRQPYASLVASGVKNIENRSRKTPHRGPLAIHAGLAVDRAVEQAEREFCAEIGVAFPKSLTGGGIIGVVDLVGVVWEVGEPGSDFATDDATLPDDLDGTWFLGPYGWVLENARECEFCPCKGQLGLWRIASDLVKVL